MTVLTHNPRESLRAALVRLNNLYGRGDVLRIRFYASGNSGFVERKPFNCQAETRGFRIVGNTVFFLRHQSKF